MLYNNPKYRKILKEELARAYKQQLTEKKRLDKIKWSINQIRSKDFNNYKQMGFSDIFNIKRISNMGKNLKDLKLVDYLKTFKKIANELKRQEGNVFTGSNLIFVGPNYKKSPKKSVDVFVMPKKLSLNFETGFKNKRLLGKVGESDIYELEDFFAWIKEIDKEATQVDQVKAQGASPEDKEKLKQRAKKDKAVAAALVNSKAAKKIQKNIEKANVVDRSGSVITDELPSSVAHVMTVAVDDSGKEDVTVKPTDTKTDIKRNPMPSNFKTRFGFTKGNAFRIFFNKPELISYYGKESEFDLDASGKPDNSYIRKAYYAALQDGKARVGPFDPNTPNGDKMFLAFSNLVKLPNDKISDTDTEKNKEKKEKLPKEDEETFVTDGGSTVNQQELEW